jgi:hypothetical protein
MPSPVELEKRVEFSIVDAPVNTGIIPFAPPATVVTGVGVTAAAATGETALADCSFVGRDLPEAGCWAAEVTAIASATLRTKGLTYRGFMLLP